MEFHQIRYFLAACDHGSFTRAAEAAAVSQPALTVAIRKLEEEIGGQLFLREAGGVRLTELGRTMRTHLARIEETRRAADRAARAARAGERAEEVVDLGVYSTIGPRSICGAIGAFRKAEPMVRLVLHDVWGERAYDLLRSGAVDCALVARHGPARERIAARRLFEEPMVLAMAEEHPLATGRLTPERLAGAVYLDRLRCEFRSDILEEFAGRGISLDTRLSSEPEDWVQSAIAAGEGVTIVPRDQVILPGIVTREIEGVQFTRVIEIATMRGRAIPPAAERLVGFLAGHDWHGLAERDREGA